MTLCSHSVLFLILGLISCNLKFALAYTYYKDVDKYYSYHTTEKSWVDAKLNCAEEGGSLAMPRNEHEYKILKNLTSGDKVFGKTIWVGLHDYFDASDWVGLKGDSVQNYYNNWASTDPNNAHGIEHCGCYLFGYSELYDIRCDSSFSFVCEKKGLREDDVQPDCFCPYEDKQYICAEDLGKCYKLHTNPALWANARRICMAEGGTLAIIKNKAEEEFLTSLMKKPVNKAYGVPFTNHVLIGFHDMFREGLLMSVKDDVVKDFGYLNIYLLNGGTGENCMSMYVTGGIDDYPCYTKGAFICEKEIHYQIAT